MTAPFARRLLAWFDRHGRHDLPWQTPRTPYRVWLAEIMLQQTQVAAVIPYFQRFVARFPDVQSLAAAPADDVLQHWAGLGYYARARNLQRAAQRVVGEHGGEFPREIEAMTALPGVGRSTAGAVLAQAYDERHAILDGNVKRVLARHGAIEGWPGEPRVSKRLWALSESLLPEAGAGARMVDYTQAIMDLGATLCTARNPACGRCPVSADCQAYVQGRVAQFPAPKPKRARPQRQARLLLVENTAGELLFERRPPAGIWGGLWCPPVLEGDGDAASWLQRERGLSAQELESLAPVSHGFTHFELELQPLRLRLSGDAGSLREQSGQRWINMGADTLPGLPAPIARLLARLRQPPQPDPQQALALEPASAPRRGRPRKAASS